MNKADAKLIASYQALAMLLLCGDDSLYSRLYDETMELASDDLLDQLTICLHIGHRQLPPEYLQTGAAKLEKLRQFHFAILEIIEHSRRKQGLSGPSPT